MSPLPLLLAVALAAPGTPARNARPTQRDTAPEATSGAQPTPTDDEVAQRARTYLGSIDTPISAAQWKALGGRAVPVLESVVRDPDALPSRRAKAVSALSIIGGARARAVVLEVAQSEDEPFGVRASALRGAPRLLGPKELTATLRPVLEKAREAPVRATAAEVLVKSGGSSACNAVRAQVDREPGHVKPQYARALDRCPSTP